jgi:hypothetical protein
MEGSSIMAPRRSLRIQPWRAVLRRDYLVASGSFADFQRKQFAPLGPNLHLGPIGWDAALWTNCGRIFSGKAAMNDLALSLIVGGAALVCSGLVFLLPSGSTRQERDESIDESRDSVDLHLQELRRRRDGLS